MRRDLHRTSVAASTAALSLAVFASSLAGQACLALGTIDEQAFAMGTASFTDGAWGPGFGIGYDASGPLTLGAEGVYTFIDNSDAAVASVGGFVAAELPTRGLSICPLASVSYVWLADEGELTGLDADGFVFGGGLAVGGRLESEGDFAFIPAAQARLIHARSSASFGGVSGTDSETFGNFAGALTLAFGQIFFGPRASITTQDGAEPVFTVVLGAAF